MWHVLEHREIRRLARGRDAARHGPRPRPDQPTGTDLLPQIRHIVVLMMENHSYGGVPGSGRLASPACPGWHAPGTGR